MKIDVNSPAAFLIYCGIFFAAILFRYLVAAGAFYYYYYKLKKDTFALKKLNKRPLKKHQLKNEVVWSVKSSAVFALVATATYWLWSEGYTALYFDFYKFGLWYLPVSLVILSLLHETYYYWAHRWMHHPSVFKIVHKVHHDSHTPTPWTAFSFHPWESLLEALILPLLLILIPVNIYVLGIYLLLMTLSSVINHLNIEIYPVAFQKSHFGRLFIGATHHHHHHKEYITNYGLYFTFWDKIMGTESPKMEQEN